MKLIFFGYNSIVNFLANDAFISEKCEIIIFNNKKVKGVSKMIVKNSTKEVYKSLKELSITNNDFLLSIGSPWILSEQILELVGYRILNLHGAHLPNYRGGTIHSWYILNRKRTGLCCLHQMTVAIDAGNIMYYKEYFIPPACRTPQHLIDLSVEENTLFLKDIINHWLVDNEHPFDHSGSTQPEYLSTYWPRLKSIDHGWIDWTWQGIDIESFICAFDNPYYGASTKWKNQHIRLKDAYFQPSENKFHPFQIGLVFRKSDNWLWVAVRDGELLVKNAIDHEDNPILNNVKVGDRFYSTPNDVLRQATKVVKTKDGLKSIKYW